MDVPDAFSTAFQTCPNDLGTARFYGSRKLTIDAILSRLRGDGGRLYSARLIRRNYFDNYGYACAGVAWEKFTCRELVQAAMCIGGVTLAAVCELMCVGGMRSSGMPDLLLWRPPPGGMAAFSGADCGALAMAVEVKSKNDSLSDKQRLWMMELERSGMPVEVMKITDKAPAASSSKRRKRTHR